ncbi:hypothetical protein BT67DRAFT_376379 [Trichocladium antarcticum]|uniref:Uncharacterized protein n=1 Tax=Trichocladium antarcticum TaxID=1450529 RepID=A0AAN6UMZ9_9PEZI|nr:hypothetical protein BT67DRAFT_376379 [Trichocladium antarcticum]
MDEKHQTALQTQETKHLDAVRRLNDQHTKEMESQRLVQEAQVQKLQQALETQVAQKRLEIDQALVQQKRLHQQDVMDMEKRVMSLESSLVDNSDDFRPATDDSLKAKYQQLKLEVETITFNLGPVNIPLDSELDPDRFLEKEGKTETRFLLQSIIWARIKDGFFSSPFGLGALGTSDGKKKLLDLYVAYRNLFDLEPPPSGPLPETEASSIALFRTSSEANRWRSAAFQSLLVAVTPKRGSGNGSGSGSGSGTAKPPSSSPTLTGADLKSPYLVNRAHVHATILALLAEVCTAAIPDSIAATVAHLVAAAGELALELGVQRAELGLEMPARGAQVQIGGSGFLDCYDGDADRGVTKDVVLAVSPRLYKRGDGRGDLRTGRVVFHGEVYVARG